MPKLDIPKPYADTLALLRGRKRYKARDLADLIDVSPPVMHARLEWLARKGLVTRENVGRGNEYFRPNGKLCHESAREGAQNG